MRGCSEQFEQSHRRSCGAIELGRVVNTLMLLTLTGKGSIWSDKTGLFADMNFMGDVIPTEANLGNIDVGLTAASGKNSVAQC